MAMKWLAMGLLLMTGGCASVPSDINNACVIYDENGGLFNNWYKQNRKVEKEYGVPINVQLATIWKESGFRHNARPPRKKLLGFIPWKRPSDAYGYAQALKSTWKSYEQDTGRGGADRNDYYDASRFIGWYHKKSNATNSIPLNDAYHLYLAYYSGHGGYQRGTWKNNSWLKSAASKVASQSEKYRAQLAQCGRL